MNRRRVLKSIGFASVLGAVAFPAACASAVENTEKETKSPTDTTTKAADASLDKRSKLIVNRKEMSFHDPEKPSDFEYKHMPNIVLGEKNAKGFTRIDVGIGQKGIIHPTEDNHWIDYIKLWQNDALIGIVEFEIGVAGGFASFYINASKGDNIIAEAGCNLHGIWKSSIEV